MTGLIMIAHGSKKNVSNDEFKNLVNEIKMKDDEFQQINVAFLEFAQPTVFMAVKNQIEKHINTIYLYPYFLNSGKHVSVDLPTILTTLQNEYRDTKFVLLNHFGKSNSISDIIVNDIKSIGVLT